MADALLTSLADAVVTAINGAGLAYAVTATRTFLPRVLTEKAALVDDTHPPTVAVRPAANPEDRLGGGGQAAFQGHYAVEVVIAGRIDSQDATEAVTAKLVLLGEQIRDLFKRQQLSVASRSAILTKAGGEQAYSLELLLQEHTFLSGMPLTFQVLN